MDHYLSPLLSLVFHTLLDFIQKGLTWTNVSPQKKPVFMFPFDGVIIWKTQHAHTRASLYKFVIHNNKTPKETPTEES